MKEGVFMESTKRLLQILFGALSIIIEDEAQYNESSTWLDLWLNNIGTSKDELEAFGIRIEDDYTVKLIETSSQYAAAEPQ
jgi:hypothetical protein